jgi:hypothetical protein
MSNVIDVEKLAIIADIEKFKVTKDKGHGWIQSACVLLIRLATTIKEIKEMKEHNTRALKIKYDLASAPFLSTIKTLEEKNKSLRDRLLTTYTGDESIVLDEWGEIVIKKPWTYEVIDLTKVPKEYLSVDSSKINNAIDEGTRSIPGINISQSRTVAVVPLKKAKSAPVE